MGHIQREAEKRAKLDKCYICGKDCSSFCNSHSVPKFCLKRIAPKGKLYFSGMQQDFPMLGEDKGVSDSGTFHIICDDCDNTCFQDYESPEAYLAAPTGKMLAQIAMKNYLHIISKRLIEKELYTIAAEHSPINGDFFQSQRNIVDLDLSEYVSAYKRAKIAAKGGHDDWYYLCYFKEIDYVVPYAAQSKITLISDFDGRIINDIYNLTPNCHVKDLHVAVFPLERKSVIIIFLDSRIKVYRNFYRQLNKLDLPDQLSAINYIIHAYTENVFLSKDIPQATLSDRAFKEVCQKSDIVLSSSPFANITDGKKFAMEEFSLSNRHKIPNLLSKEFSLANE